jgi:hypothetical protein
MGRALFADAMMFVQEQGMLNSQFLSVNKMIGGKDVSLAAVVDETIQLWTHMWVVDAEHDNIIAENVQNLQRRCGDLIRQLIKELQGLGLSPMPSLHHAKKKLGAAVREEPPRC